MNDFTRVVSLVFLGSAFLFSSQMSFAGAVATKCVGCIKSRKRSDAQPQKDSTAPGIDIESQEPILQSNHRDEDLKTATLSRTDQKRLRGMRPNRKKQPDSFREVEPVGGLAPQVRETPAVELQNKSREEKHAALMAVIKQGNLDLVKSLLAAKTDVNYTRPISLSNTDKDNDPVNALEGAVDGWISTHITAQNVWKSKAADEILLEILKHPELLHSNYPGDEFECFKKIYEDRYFIKTGQNIPEREAAKLDVLWKKVEKGIQLANQQRFQARQAQQTHQASSTCDDAKLQSSPTVAPVVYQVQVVTESLSSAPSARTTRNSAW